MLPRSFCRPAPRQRHPGRCTVTPGSPLRGVAHGLVDLIDGGPLSWVCAEACRQHCRNLCRTVLRNPASTLSISQQCSVCSGAPPNYAWGQLMHCGYLLQVEICSRMAFLQPLTTLGLEFEAKKRRSCISHSIVLFVRQDA